MAFNIILLLKIGAEWWESLGYFGDSVLFADLGVGIFKPAQGRSSQSLTALNPLRGDFAIRGRRSPCTLNSASRPALVSRCLCPGCATKFPTP